MAIEKVKRAWFLVERTELDAFIQALAASRTTHVVDLREQELGLSPALSAAAEHSSAAEARDQMQKLSRTLDVLDEFAPRKRALHENFVNLPMEMTRAEFDAAVAEVDINRVHDHAVAIRRSHAEAAKRSDELRTRIAELLPWAAAYAPPAGLRHCGVGVGTVPARVWPRLEAAARNIAELAVERVATADGAVLLAVAWTNASGREARDMLAAHGFQPLNVEAGSGRIGGIIDAARAELAGAESKVAALEAEAAKLAEDRRKLIAALAHSEAELERSEASGKAVASKRIAVLSGYVRVREMDKLAEMLRRDFPDIGLVAEDPKPGEDVPVSLGGSKFFAPAQFLTSMFGLPDYFGFDPSPYILLTFLLFFGFCFGDAVYGAALALAGLWLARKAGENRSLVKFFRLLALGGMVSVAVGVLTGSWAGNLFSEEYLGKGNLLAELPKLAVFDPLQKPVAALGIALALGVANQFYALILLMYREWRKGNAVGAICDGGLWLVFLGGLVLLILAPWAMLPGAVSSVALGVVVLSGVGLVFTQGRHEKTLLGKALTGVVSLYGIVGTYGTTGFIGDTLSYSRLLALGLTTVVVAQSANLVAWMLGSVPVVGVAVVTCVLVLGHVFNFLISILGGFVHSLRLIFVEFFTKFYEGGGKPFAPLGAPQTVRVVAP